MIYKDAIALAIRRPGSAVRRPSWPAGQAGLLNQLSCTLLIFRGGLPVSFFLSVEDTHADDWVVSETKH
jgi:hypothetical protein